MGGRGARCSPSPATAPSCAASRPSPLCLLPSSQSVQITTRAPSLWHAGRPPRLGAISGEASLWREGPGPCRPASRMMTAYSSAAAASRGWRGSSEATPALVMVAEAGPRWTHRLYPILLLLPAATTGTYCARMDVYMGGMQRGMREGEREGIVLFWGGGARACVLLLGRRFFHLRCAHLVEAPQCAGASGVFM